MHDIAQHLHKAEERCEDLPVAITLGNDPVISIAASTPMAYDENEYELAGALRGAPAPITKAPLTGLPVPWGSEVVIEGVIEGRKREIEGPFGEFTGHYSGGGNMTVIRIDRISYRTDPVFEHLYLGMPWTEIDYLMAASTCVPLYQQLNKDFPEVQAVNAMYTHGLVVIVSTEKRYGGFAKAVGMRVLTTPHGPGYAATVIVVDEDVDPFNLPQVMWALSTKMNPDGDLIQIPNLSVLELAPQANTPGITARRFTAPGRDPEAPRPEHAARRTRRPCPPQRARTLGRPGCPAGPASANPLPSLEVLTMTTLVLVHGLWADGSCWSETITELRELGHEAVAVQLALTSMDDDIAAVHRTLSTVNEPVLLVGWSYGGAVITNAAHGQDSVKALSYIAAFMPDEGETVSDIAHRHPGSLLPQHLKATGDGHSYIDRAAYGQVMAADAPTQRTALAGAVQKYPRLGIDSTPSGAPAWRELPTHYLVAADDRALPAATQRELAARAGATTTEWATGHGPMYARPKELAAYLAAIARKP